MANLAEECSCGHLKTQHNDSYGAEFHGDCRLCGCEKFTWKRFVKMDGF